jgi:hypothetical protein
LLPVDGNPPRRTRTVRYGIYDAKVFRAVAEAGHGTLSPEVGLPTVQRSG